MDAREIPLNADEAAKAARGEIWVDINGVWRDPWRPPAACSFVPLAQVQGDWMGRRVLRLCDDRSYQRGLYVAGPAQLGVQMPSAPDPQTVYVPLAVEAAWWEHRLLGTPFRHLIGASLPRIWLDEAEDPTPRG